MTQQQVVILCFKVALIAGFASIALWIGVYTRLAKWWTNPVGRSLVIKSSLLAVLLVPTTLSLFFNFSRLTSEVAGWIDVVLIGAICPVMLWRVRVFWRMGKSRGVPRDGDSP